MRGAVAINEMGDAMAVRVGRMLETTHGNHIVYLNGFDPATDEVIIIKKDAARAWIEGYTNSEVLHGEQPEWDVSTWYSARYGYCERVVNKSKVVGVANHDCVEFVAVKTHRPPVAEPVPELSNEAKVKAVYPDAIYSDVYGCVFNGCVQLSNGVWGKDMAWKYAACRLESASEPVSNLPLGCGVEVVSGAVLAN